MEHQSNQAVPATRRSDIQRVYLLWSPFVVAVESDVISHMRFSFQVMLSASQIPLHT